MNLKDSSELKALNSQLIKLKAQRDSVIKEIEFKQQESSMLKKRINTINKKIEFLKKKNEKRGDLIITEHAMLRYIERVMGIDLSLIEKKIKAEIQNIYQQMGDGTYPIGDGKKAKIKDGNVITILE